MWSCGALFTHAEMCGEKEEELGELSTFLSQTKAICHVPEALSEIACRNKLIKYTQCLHYFLSITTIYLSYFLVMNKNKIKNKIF